MATNYLANSLRHINSQAPGLTFDLQNFRERSYLKLDQGDADLIISAGLQAPSKFMRRTLMEESLVCLLDENHPALKQWTAETIFLYPHVRLSLLDEQDDPVEQYAKKEGMPARKTGLITGSLNLQPALLVGTHLIAFVPATVANNAAVNDALVAKECAFKLPSITLQAIWHERDQKAPAHQWVEKSIRALLKKTNK